MEVVRCPSAAEFLRLTTSYRAVEPIRTNILGSVATSVTQRDDGGSWWLIHAEDGEVVGAAMRTAPFGMQIGPMPDEAASALGDEVARVDHELPWVFGSENTVQQFLARYLKAMAPGRVSVSRGRCDVIYEAGDVIPSNVEGMFVQAAIGDFDLAHQWTLEFYEFIDGAPPRFEDADRDALRATLLAGSIWFWTVDGSPVSMAGHAWPVETPYGIVTRVGPVYTPAPLRGHGYGAGVVASLTHVLLRRDSRVMLYADAGNPTSNGVYRRIGYREVDRVVRFEFAWRLGHPSRL
jgi:RimJ/RimL family protein N-acetyltransferase